MVQIWIPVFIHVQACSLLGQKGVTWRDFNAIAPTILPVHEPHIVVLIFDLLGLWSANQRLNSHINWRLVANES